MFPCLAKLLWRTKSYSRDVDFVMKGSVCAKKQYCEIFLSKCFADHAKSVCFTRFTLSIVCGWRLQYAQKARENLKQSATTKYIQKMKRKSASYIATQAVKIWRTQLVVFVAESAVLALWDLCLNLACVESFGNDILRRKSRLIGKWTVGIGVTVSER